VGGHCAHGDEFGSSLFDISSVISKLKRHLGAIADVLVLADFNCDMLSTLSCDPFAGQNLCSFDIFERRGILDA